MLNPDLLALITAMLGVAEAVVLLTVALIAARHQRPANPRHTSPLDRPHADGHHQVMGAPQPRRWADLDPAERERRQQQSQVDKDRAAAAAAEAAADTVPAISESEGRRRQSQSDRDRAHRRAVDEHEQAMYRTVLGGDINFMDKHDW